MPRYVFIYHAPPMPTDMAPPSAEEGKAMMDAWYAWAQKVGDDLEDLGVPLGGGQHVTPGGVQDSTREVAGYSILNADSMDAALDLAKVHPHLNMPGGCTIEVHEAMPLPDAAT
ncbi:YciI family protein [Demequina flava]|uniref:YciI family protein n=1 Tax=Demequina flava TaxID=1095025 RepID=UPI000785EE05|nr:hypothetical protein [Demequina flava]